VKWKTFRLLVVLTVVSWLKLSICK